MRTAYIRILGKVFYWCWLHVPVFADYAIEFVGQVQHKIHKRMMQKDWIAEARKELEESGTIKIPP